jgi:hypothetical protein
MIDVIVLTVDRTNLPGLKDCLSEVDYRLRLVDNTERRDRNYSQSLNLAMTHRTPGNRVLFISDDARPRPGAIKAMLAHDDPFVSTINVSSDGTVNHAGMYFADDKWPMHIGRGWDLSDVPSDCTHYQCATFACTLVNPDVLDSVGDFDEAYNWSHEEVDYMLRAREAGFGPPLVCSDAIIDHDEHGVSDTPRQFRQNVLHYNEKWITSGRLERLWQPQAH